MSKYWNKRKVYFCLLGTPPLPVRPVSVPLGSALNGVHHTFKNVNISHPRGVVCEEDLPDVLEVIVSLSRKGLGIRELSAGEGVVGYLVILHERPGWGGGGGGGGGIKRKPLRQVFKNGPLSLAQSFQFPPCPFLPFLSPYLLGKKVEVLHVLAPGGAAHLSPDSTWNASFLPSPHAPVEGPPVVHVVPHAVDALP